MSAVVRSVVSRSRPLLRVSPFTHGHPRPHQTRHYNVLAIESSCDDASVALIRRDPANPVELVDYKCSSLDSTSVGGIIPTEAKNHHQKTLARMVKEILPRGHSIDLVCATRGPGMMGSLSAGFNLAKGLAVAWDVPIVGVHHMLGHLLTPRFFSTGDSPAFPFVSLLASGGHTILVLSKSLVDHEILADSVDIAVGDMLDKCGREIGVRGTMIGKELERLTAAHSDALTPLPDQFKAWTLPNPLQNQQGRTNMTAFSFAPFISALKRILESRPNGEPLSELEQLTLATEIQRAIFHHLVSKVGLSLDKAVSDGKIHPTDPIDFVCAGGVASNQYLRANLKAQLPSRLRYHFPEPRWCTDNAMMIGWAGIELWEAGYHTNLEALTQAKWPIPDLLALNCWEKMSPL